MGLELDTLLPFLLARGLVSPAEVVDGELTLEDVSRRNDNFKVLRPGRQGYFLKQPLDEDAARTVAVEAQVNALLHSHAALSDAMVVPLLVRREPEGLLVFELIADAPSAQELARAGELPAGIASQLGRALGTLHASFRVEETAGRPEFASLPRRPPWVLSAHQPRPEMLAELSSGNAKLLRILTDDRSLGHALGELGEEWQCSSLVHGDVKADNILVQRRQDGELRVALVDWELSHLGDPAWDLGSALAAAALAWVSSMPDSRGLRAEERAEAATFTVEELQSFARDLWLAYARAARLGDKATAELRRSVRFSGARLVQTASEVAQDLSWLPNYAVVLLQLAANVLAAPERAAADLFGLDGSIEAAP